MRVAFLVFLLLSVLVVERSQAEWVKWGLEKLKQAVKAVVDWAKRNCTIGTGGFNCSLRWKRSAGGGPPNPEMMKSKQELCDSIMEDNIMLQDGLTFDVIKNVFEAVDGGMEGDDILAGQEFDNFVEALDIFHECIQSARKRQPVQQQP